MKGRLFLKFLFKKGRATEIFAPFSLFAILGLELAIFKVLKIAKLSGKLSHVGLGVMSDVGFALVGGALFSIILMLSRGWLNKLFRIFLYIFISLAAIFAAVEHGFFILTGSVTNWYLVKYSFSQLPILGKLIWQQILFGSGLFLLLPLFIGAIPRLLLKISFFRKLSKAKTYPLPLSFGVLLIGASLLALSYRYKLPGEVRLAGENIFLRLGGQIADDILEKNPHLSIPSAIAASKLKAEKLFSTRTLRFKKTPNTRDLNVVLIILESLRARSSTVYNPELQTTPFLAEMAKNALVIEQFYPIIPHTSKALVSIICGIPPKIAMPISEAQPGGLPGRCLPHLFAGLGYSTAFFQAATKKFENRGQLLKNMGYQTIKTHESLPTEGFFKTNSFGYEDRLILEPSIRWIREQRKKNRKFFLTYLTLISHFEYNTPPEFPKRVFEKTDDWEYHKYLNAIHYLDLFLKDLFARFEKLGMLEDTLFVLVADHGEAFSEHKRRQHDNGLWEEIVHSAALLYAPALWKKGRRIGGIWHHLDILTTIAAALNLKIEGGEVRGKVIFRDDTRNREIYMSCWYEKFCLAVRKGDIKLIYYYDNRPVEVFDLRRDPLEKNNLAYTYPFEGPFIKRQIEKLLNWKFSVNQTYRREILARQPQAVSYIPPRADVKVGAKFGDLVELYGYRVERGALEIGGELEITYIFKALRKIPKGWRLFFHLEQDSPPRFVNLDHIPLNGSYPLEEWAPGQFVSDRHLISIPQNFKKGGTVRLYIGLWAKGKGRAPISAPKKWKRRITPKRRFILLEKKL